MKKIAKTSFIKSAFSKIDKKELKIFLTFFIIYLAFAGIPTANELSKLDLTRAIVDEHSFKIDSYYNNTIDRAYYKGHYYSTKAPGSSFLAVPIYAIYKSVARAIYGQDNLDYSLSSPLLMLVIIAFTEVLCGALSVVLVYKISRYFANKEKHRMLATVAYGLGTLVFAYSRFFLGHAIATFFAFFSFYLIFKMKKEKKDYSFLAGLMAGFAILTRYETIIIAFGCLILLISLKKLKPIAKFLLGFFILVLVLFAYNYAIFGNFLTFGILHPDPTIWGRFEKEAAALEYKQIGDYDNFYFYKAASTLNTTYCSLIIKESRKTECYDNVKVENLSIHLDKLDKNLRKEYAAACDEINLPDYSNYCKALTLSNLTYCEKIKDISEDGLRENCYEKTLAKIPLSYSILPHKFYSTYCEDIENSSLRRNCERKNLINIPLSYLRLANTVGLSPVEDIGRFNAKNVLRLLIYPERGLLFYSPILILSLVSLFFMFKEYKLESILILFYLGYFLFYFSFVPFFWGSFGPKYLTPLTPFLMLPLLFSIKKINIKIVSFLIILSILINLVCLQVDWGEPGVIFQEDGQAIPIEELYNKMHSWNVIWDPLFEHHLPEFLKYGPRSLLLEQIFKVQFFPFLNVAILAGIAALIWRKEFVKSVKSLKKKACRIKH